MSCNLKISTFYFMFFLWKHNKNEYVKNRLFFASAHIRIPFQLWRSKSISYFEMYVYVAYGKIARITVSSVFIPQLTLKDSMHFSIVLKTASLFVLSYLPYLPGCGMMQWDGHPQWGYLCTACKRAACTC